MTTTLTTDAVRRHRRAIVRAARMGGALAGRVRAALDSCLDAIPATPGPADLFRLRRHVEGAVKALGPVLSDRLRRMLLAAAEREHLAAARQLTRVWNGRVPSENLSAVPSGVVGRSAGNVRGVLSISEVVSEDWRDYLRLLIPAPVLSVLESIVGTAYRALTRLIDPQRASNVVLQGVAQGKDRKQIAKDLEQVFGGYESAARRVARTEGLRVATATQLAVSEQIPDLVVGYELYTVLDDRVRPEHRRQHGWKFYRNPKSGQRGLDQCPQPPVWNGQLAHNCRCMLTPIIEIDGEVV